MKNVLGKQILVIAVDKGSPADGILTSGDVILGVGDKPFGDDARVQLARAITAAEEEKNGGLFRLIRWRDGKTDDVELKLPVMGTYGDTAPYAFSRKRPKQRGRALHTRGIWTPSAKSWKPR